MTSYQLEVLGVFFFNLHPVLGRNKHSERHLRTCRNQHFAASLLTPKTASSSLQLPAPQFNSTMQQRYKGSTCEVKCGKYSVFWRPLKLFFLGGEGDCGGVLFFCPLQPPISGFFFQCRVRRYIIETNEVGVSCQRHCSTEAITQLHRRVPKWLRMCPCVCVCVLGTHRATEYQRLPSSLRHRASRFN